MDIYSKFPDLLDPDIIEEFDFSDCWTKTHPDDAIGELDVAMALSVTRGNLSGAARLLGRSRRQVETFVLRNLLLRDFYEDIDSANVDNVESVLLGLALGGHAGSCQYIMKTKGKGRGYVEAAPIGPGATRELDEMTLEELMAEARERGIPTNLLG